MLPPYLSSVPYNYTIERERKGTKSVEHKWEKEG
jgi:hypothetical protein